MAKQTLEQFGQTIKQKYPQYGDISDTELGQKMLAKYPQYQDIVDTATPEPAKNQNYWGRNETSDQANQRMSNTVSSIFPGKQVGQAIGSLAGYGVNAAQEALGYAPNGSTEAYKQGLSTNPAPSPLQVGGDIAKGVSMVAGLKAPVPNATTLAETIGKNALQGAGFAALSGAGQGAVESSGETLPTTSDIAHIASKAFWSGLIGSAIGGIAGATQYGLKILADKAPKALYNTALNISARIKAADKSPAEFLNDEKVWGGLGSILKQSQQGIAQENSSISSKIAANEFEPVGSEVLDNINKKATQILSSKIGNLYSPEDIAKLIDDVPKARIDQNANNFIDMEALNKTRQQLGSLIGNGRWLQSNPTEKTAAAQAVYTALSNYVKDATDSNLEFDRLSQWIRTNQAVTKAINAADKKFVPGFYDWTSGAVGSALGLFAGNPVAGGLAGVALERATRSPATMTAAAQAIPAISKFVSGPGSTIAKTIGSTAASKITK